MIKVLFPSTASISTLELGLGAMVFLKLQRSPLGDAGEFTSQQLSFHRKVAMEKGVETPSVNESQFQRYMAGALLLPTR